MVVVVDSARAPNGAALSLAPGMRAPARPGYIYQSVTVEIQQAAQTRIIGTSCWHDAGIVVRGTEQHSPMCASLQTHPRWSLFAYSIRTATTEEPNWKAGLGHLVVAPAVYVSQDGRESRRS